MQNKTNHSMGELKTQTTPQIINTFVDLIESPEKFNIYLVSLLAILSPREIKVADEQINGGIHFFVSGDCVTGKSSTYANLIRTFGESINHKSMIGVVDAWGSINEDMLESNTLLVLDDMSENDDTIVSDISKYLKGIKRFGHYLNTSGFVNTNVSTVQIFQKMPIQRVKSLSTLSDVCATVFFDIPNQYGTLKQEITQTQRNINEQALKEVKNFINNVDQDNIYIEPFKDMKNFTQATEWIMENFIGVNFQNYGGPIMFKNIIKLAVSFAALSGNIENEKLIVTEHDFKEVIKLFGEIHRIQDNKDKQYLLKLVK